MSQSRPAEHPRVQELRKRLALDRLAPGVGAALLTSSTDHQNRALRQLGRVLTDPLSPGAGKLIRHTVCVMVYDFAALAANQGLHHPPAADLLRRAGEAEARSLLRAGTTEGLLAVVATAIREQIARNPVLAVHTVALHTSLRRYLDHLQQAVPSSRPAQPPAPPLPAANERPDNVASFLYHDLVQHFGARVQQACVTVQIPATKPDPTTATTTATTPGSNRVEGAYLEATDHVAFLHPTAFLPTPTEGSDPSAVALQVGPVPVQELVRAYQSAVLLARMIHLGWAHPPGPIQCHPHAQADFPLSLLEELAPHLQPLLTAPLPHRIELARTLRRMLVKPGTMQQHAKALCISTSTLRQRLEPLQPILGQNGPPPSQLIALATILPALDFLWKAELNHNAPATGTHIEIVVTFEPPPTPPPRDVP
ncbi:hypothetical protein [Nocardioides sp. W7]|uniref:hypothetical protein n=1 Tax=Nocardioides sp. W7 TaxID=2931390 RepID=UPI001FD25C02|nr:hypothetical protein [Nocardioides sp. W7]